MATIRKTIEHFNGHLKDLPEALKAIKSPSAKDRYLNREFSGNFSSLDEACQMIETGDPELFKRYKEQEETTIKAPGINKYSYQAAEEGLYFSVPAYLEGVPEQWIQEVEEQAPGKVGDLIINVFAGQYMKEELIFNKLINIVKLIDAAEQSGHRLNIFVFANMEAAGGKKPNPYKENVKYKIQIKRDRDPVNLQQLVYLIASPVLLRFVMLWLNTDHAGAHAGNYYCIDERAEINNPEIIYIPSLAYDVLNNITDYSDLPAVYPHLRELI